MRKSINIVAIILSVIAIILCSYVILKNSERKITVSFNTNSSTVLSNLEIAEGESIVLPVPERENYNFLGWYINDEKIDSNYKFESNTIVSAKWEEKEYILSFDTDGGNSIESVTLKCGLITLPASPIKEGYIFEKWQDAHGNDIDNNSTLPCENQTIKAIWQENAAPKTYTVTFDSVGGSAVASQNIEIGKTAKNPTNPTKSGYKFVEWQLNGIPYNFNKPVTGDITLVAKWQDENQVPKKIYTITLINERDSLASSNKVYFTCGVAITGLPVLPNTTAGVFAGWMDRSNNKIYENGNIMPCNDITLYAAWLRGGAGAKPIIYLYPERKLDVTVKLGYPNLLTTVYPKYNNGWNVIAYPSGKLIDKNTGRSLYSLYWEGSHYPGKVTDEGFVVKGEDTTKFLEEKLAILGLNEREAEEFIIYWLPQMEHNKYNYIKFATKEEIDSYMPLRITPKPDTIIRVMMEFIPLDKKIEVKEQKLTKVERVGYTAVEWGGSKLNTGIVK